MVRPSAAAAEKFMRSVVTPPLLDIMYDFCWSALPALPLRMPVIQRRECVREMNEEKALIERDDDIDVVARRRRPFPREAHLLSGCGFGKVQTEFR